MTQKIDKIELKKIIRIVMEWMIDDYATVDIISQAMSKWDLDEKQANDLLTVVRKEWIKCEQENNEEKRLRKIETLKKHKRSMSPQERTTAMGISVLLSIDKELFRLEGMAPSKILNGFDKLPKEIVINAKQEAFCREFVLNNNGTQAAIKAGHSKKTAASIASENLRKPNIKKFIELLREDQRRLQDLQAETIVDDLRDLADYNIQDYLTPGNGIKDITTLTRRQTKAITGIKTKEKILPDGSKEITTELKLTDRRATLVDLGRHIGIFEKDNRQKANPQAQLSDDQFNKLLTSARETKTTSG